PPRSPRERGLRPPPRATRARPTTAGARRAPGRAPWRRPAPVARVRSQVGHLLRGRAATAQATPVVTGRTRAAVTVGRARRPPPRPARPWEPMLHGWCPRGSAARTRR